MFLFYVFPFPVSAVRRHDSDYRTGLKETGYWQKRLRNSVFTSMGICQLEPCFCQVGLSDVVQEMDRLHVPFGYLSLALSLLVYGGCG